MILGHALWQSRFAGDPAVVGRSIRIDDSNYTVVGVARPGFDFPEGRLQPGVSTERARTQLSASTAALPNCLITSTTRWSIARSPPSW
ncbi:MAG: ABC transporter permease [Longimicrobiales bacterium]